MGDFEKRAVWTKPDGTISIMHHASNMYVPADKEALEFDDFSQHGEGDPTKRLATPEEIYARDIKPENIMPGTTWHVIDIMDLPESHLGKESRDFRNAWVHENGKVTVHMDKAKEIHKRNLRVKRAEKLPILDIEEMKALRVALNDGNKEPHAAVVAKKQVLLDITKHPEIDAAQTPAELRIAALSVLGE